MQRMELLAGMAFGEQERTRIEQHTGQIILSTDQLMEIKNNHVLRSVSWLGYMHMRIPLLVFLQSKM